MLSSTACTTYNQKSALSFLYQHSKLSDYLAIAPESFPTAPRLPHEVQLKKLLRTI
jgi:hypothetical protein